MRTQFTAGQLQNPDMAQSEKVLRACVHCGFCNATCPTYLVTGDENDGPRGRIYLMREMLQSGAAPDARTVAHIDGCLSCLGCATTCPSGVDYMRLVDHARAHIETHFRRPMLERAFRALLHFILPYPKRFAFVLGLGKLAAPIAGLLPARLRRMIRMIPPPLSLIPPPLFPPHEGEGKRLPHEPGKIISFAEKGFAHETSPNASPPPRGEGIGVGGDRKIKRVALLAGCVQPALAPETNAATIRLLNRLGIEVVVPQGAGCCGAISHHLGKSRAAKQFARANIDAWMQCETDGPLDAIIMTASGCGAQVKDYGHLLRDDDQYQDDAARLSAITRDIGEFLFELNIPAASVKQSLRVAYHAPCSLLHGQKQSGKVEALLARAGYEVLIPDDAHLCCGAAGSYTLLQPEMSENLAARKAENLLALRPDIIATGNVGCQTQIAGGVQIPTLHWVQLLEAAPR